MVWVLTTSNQDLVCPVLITQLGSIALPGFLQLLVRQRFPTELGRTYEFDRHLLVVEKVGALENNTKGSFTDLLTHSIVDAHHI
jgi:hypothetical protein